MSIYGTTGIVLRLFVICVAYILFFYRTATKYRKDRMIVWGCITMGVFFVVMFLSKVIDLDRVEFVTPSVSIFLFVLCIYTLFLGIRDVIRWAEKKSAAKDHASHHNAERRG